MRYTIRHAVPDDAAALAQIGGHPEVVKNLLTMPNDSPADWAKRLERYRYSFVAESEADGRVIGMVGLAPMPLPRLAHVGVLHLMVHPDQHGQGIGTALMHHVINFADQWLMLHRLELSVLSTNPRAQALYERLGFQVEGRKRDAGIAFGQYVDEVIMARLRTQSVDSPTRSTIS